ncbi:MAG: hypothetical protein ACI8TP_004112, partial [Acidimicrobiales bacterium]
TGRTGFACCSGRHRSRANATANSATTGTAPAPSSAGAQPSRPTVRTPSPHNRPTASAGAQGRRGCCVGVGGGSATRVGSGVRVGCRRAVGRGCGLYTTDGSAGGRTRSGCGALAGACRERRSVVDTPLRVAIPFDGYKGGVRFQDPGLSRSNNRHDSTTSAPRAWLLLLAA